MVCSDAILGEDADDHHLHVLLLEVLSVAPCHVEEGKEWQEYEEHVTELAALLPRRDLSRICLFIQVVDTTVEPVTVAIDMELFHVSELIHRMVLEIVGFDLVILGRLRLISISIFSHHARRIELVEVLRIIAGMVVIDISITITFSREGGLLACK